MIFDFTEGLPCFTNSGNNGLNSGCPNFDVGNIVGFIHAKRYHVQAMIEVNQTSNAQSENDFAAALIFRRKRDPESGKLVVRRPTLPDDLEIYFITRNLASKVDSPLRST